MIVRLIAALALFAVSVAGPSTQFRYRREVAYPSAGPASACAVLDASVYAHARPSLDDVRLLSQGREVPYALTMSNTTYLAPTGEQAKVLNLRRRGNDIVFDLAMPQRAYTAIDLDLRGTDFVGTAKVTGSSLPGAAGKDLGTYTVFDLTAQRLGRNATLDLQESSFAYLHVQLKLAAVTGPAAKQSTFRATPAVVAGATVPPSREAQTLYTVVARTAALVQVGTQTRATFTVPPHVPVERVRVELAPGERANFSRTVTVTAHPAGAPAAENEQITSQIARIRKNEAGRNLHRENLSVPATLGANARAAATVVVTIDNGNDRPLAIASAVLEMRERKLCFAVPPGPVDMFYGDATLRAARYDFSRTFQPSQTVRTAKLGPEELNPDFRSAAPARSVYGQHPAALWIALLAVLGLLALILLRSWPRTRRNS